MIDGNDYIKRYVVSLPESGEKKTKTNIDNESMGN